MISKASCAPLGNGFASIAGGWYLLKGAFFLDRDGTINVDFAYINDPNRVELIPGSAEAIARAQRAGFLVVVVTNQSGIGRGLIGPGALPEIHARLDSLLVKVGAK